MNVADRSAGGRFRPMRRRGSPAWRERRPVSPVYPSFGTTACNGRPRSSTVARGKPGSIPARAGGAPVRPDFRYHTADPLNPGKHCLLGPGQYRSAVWGHRGGLPPRRLRVAGLLHRMQRHDDRPAGLVEIEHHAIALPVEHPAGILLLLTGFAAQHPRQGTIPARAGEPRAAVSPAGRSYDR